MSEQKIPVIKVTLSTGKIVLLREPKIADSEACAQVAGKGAGDNEALLSIRLQKELVKRLLVEVDGKALSMAQKEMIDDVFTMNEYNQVRKVITKFMGDEGNEPTIEYEGL